MTNRVNYIAYPYYGELYHHGIRGQKWGIRRYQNADGTLTAAGKKRYGTVANMKKQREIAKQRAIKVAKFIAKAAITTAVVSAGGILAKRALDKISNVVLDGDLGMTFAGSNHGSRPNAVGKHRYSPYFVGLLEIFGYHWAPWTSAEDAYTAEMNATPHHNASVSNMSIQSMRSTKPKR